MKPYCVFLSGAVLLFCSGCFWPFASGKPASSYNNPSSQISVEVLRTDLFAKGGKLVFIPFTAGMNAEAGQQLDRLSLMIVKGVSDVLRESPTAIQMIDQGDPEAGDLILEGHIEEFYGVGKRLFGIRKKPGAIVVKGEIRDRHTNESLVLISGRRDFREAGKLEALAYDVGRGIAEQLIMQEGQP